MLSISTVQGCLHGGVLSVLISSLVADELLETLTNIGINCHEYDDNIVIIARGKLEATLQKALNVASE